MISMTDISFMIQFKRQEYNRIKYITNIKNNVNYIYI